MVAPCNTFLNLPAFSSQKSGTACAIGTSLMSGMFGSNCTQVDYDFEVQLIQISAPVVDANGSVTASVMVLGSI